MVRVLVFACLSLSPPALMSRLRRPSRYRATTHREQHTSILRCWSLLGWVWPAPREMLGLRSHAPVWTTPGSDHGRSEGYPSRTVPRLRFRGEYLARTLDLWEEEGWKIWLH